MRFLGNLLWIILGGGIFLFIEYLVAGVAMCLTVIGIPFGFQSIKLSFLALCPFGKEIEHLENSTGALATILNVIWVVIGGIWIALTHLLFAVVLTLTIIGIPFAKQHIKLMSLALAPFGKQARPAA